MTDPTHPEPVPRRRGRLAACLLLVLPLGGCTTADRTLPTAAIPADYHARNPIVLANAPEALDVFPVGPTGRLDARQARDVKVFADDYRQNGQGGLVMAVPRGALDVAAVERTVEAVRRALAADGVRGPVRVGSYAVVDPSLATPVHLSYARLQASVASSCGEWPDDLASGTSLDGWDNRSYHNFGCAATKTLTAQIDDPRDVVRPRAEDPTDVRLRTRAIGSIRINNDPGTAWSGSALTGISSVAIP